MKRIGTFNPTVENLLLWAGPGVVGSFSFLTVMASRATLHHDVDRGEWYVEILPSEGGK